MYNSWMSSELWGQWAASQGQLRGLAGQLEAAHSGTQMRMCCPCPSQCWHYLGCHSARVTPGSAPALPGTGAHQQGDKTPESQPGDCPEDGQCHRDGAWSARTRSSCSSVLSQTRLSRTLIDGEPSHAGPGLFSNPSVINDLIFGQSHLD